VKKKIKALPLDIIEYVRQDNNQSESGENLFYHFYLAMSIQTNKQTKGNQIHTCQEQQQQTVTFFTAIRELKVF